MKLSWLLSVLESINILLIQLSKNLNIPIWVFKNQNISGKISLGPVLTQLEKIIWRLRRRCKNQYCLPNTHVKISQPWYRQIKNTQPIKEEIRFNFRILVLRLLFGKLHSLFIGFQYKCYPDIINVIMMLSWWKRQENKTSIAMIAYFIFFWYPKTKGLLCTILRTTEFWYNIYLWRDNRKLLKLHHFYMLL